MPTRKKHKSKIIFNKIALFIFILFKIFFFNFLRPSVLSTVFANEGFESESVTPEVEVVINRDIIARAARLSTDVSLQERRFRNLENFQQYPPRSRPESVMPEQNLQQPSSPIVVAAFPAPDYTPPMQRAAQNPNRNQRFQ